MSTRGTVSLVFVWAAEGKTSITHETKLGGKKEVCFEVGASHPDCDKGIIIEGRGIDCVPGEGHSSLSQFSKEARLPGFCSIGGRTRSGRETKVSESETSRFSSVRDGIYVLRNAHTRSIPSVRSFRQRCL